jgi:hypothetical protein
MRAALMCGDLDKRDFAVVTVTKTNGKTRECMTGLHTHNNVSVLVKDLEVT